MLRNEWPWDKRRYTNVRDEKNDKSAEETSNTDNDFHEMNSRYSTWTCQNHFKNIY